MTGNVLCASLNRDVDTVFKRSKKYRCGPGIVHNRQHTFFLCSPGNSRDVLHLESERTGCLHKYQPCVLLDQFRDRVTYVRRVIFRGDTISAQHLVTEGTRWAINTVRDQDMIPSTDQCTQSHTDGGQSRCSNYGAMSAFKISDCFTQRP